MGDVAAAGAGSDPRPWEPLLAELPPHPVARSSRASPTSILPCISCLWIIGFLLPTVAAPPPADRRGAASVLARLDRPRQPRPLPPPSVRTPTPPRPGLLPRRPREQRRWSPRVAPAPTARLE